MVNHTTLINLFEDREMRCGILTKDDGTQEKRWACVDLVAAALPGSQDPGAYWRTLKKRLKMEGSELVTDFHKLPICGANGKTYQMDTVNLKEALRLIQSIPSPKVEPLKIWLAKVGVERVEETVDPELGVQRSHDRARAEYHRRGHDEEWINRRLQGIAKRNELTAEWKRCKVDGNEYAKLTDEVSRGWSDMSTGEYREYKGIQKKDNLRDNMSSDELAISMLAEHATTAISKAENPTTFNANMDVARRGGRVGKAALEALEAELGRSVVTHQNALDFAERPELAAGS